MAAETDTGMPEPFDIPEAVAALLAEPEESAPAAPDAGSTERVDDPEDEGEETERNAFPPGTDLEESDDVPDFWTEEDKALWPEVPKILRPILHKYERQRTAFLHQKTREAIEVRKEAVKVAQEATERAERFAAWWQQNSAALEQGFADKWSQVDWNKLAEENPAEWTRLKQKHDNEAALLAEADRRGQADIAAAQEKVEQELLGARQAEHAKLAERLPEYFGPERARQTYDALSRFLFSRGIPADRIEAIYEAPIIELALSAMRFELAQDALRRRERGEEQGRSPRNPAKTTPTRIAPGPAARLDNRNTDAVRQAAERFKQSGGTSIADAAELIRLSGL